MRRSKNHRNTTRLTTSERSAAIATEWYDASGSWESEIQRFDHLLLLCRRALQAHARQTLARERARREKEVSRGKSR